MKPLYRNSLDYPWSLRFHLNGRGSSSHAIICSAPKNAEVFKLFLRTAIRKKLWMLACIHRIGKDTTRFTMHIGEFRKIVRYADEIKKALLM